jgi:release factor glutamine methyltransferase
MNATWTVRSVLAWTAEYFDRRGVEAPRLTAEVLLAHVLGATRVQLYIDLDRPLSRAELAGHRALIERRASGEPTHYLTGAKEFYGRSFRVDKRVLIPRPETELLVDKVLEAIPKDAPCRVLDLGTGSGCIAVTIAAERPNAQVVATEVSRDACELARANAAVLKVRDRVRILDGDLFGPLERGTRFDVAVSNPPYIPSAEISGLAPEVRNEPLLALDGGADGLSVTRQVAAQAAGWLEPGGLLALEVNERLGRAVLNLLEASGFLRASLEKDFSRLDRVAFGYRP